MTRPCDARGRYGFWLFVAVSIVLYVGAFAGPPPPSVCALAIVALTGRLVPFWAAWFDRHRTVEPARGSASAG